MPYGIMRVEKRTSDAVYGLEAEACRRKADHDRGKDFSLSDIDWAETDGNIRLRAVPDSWGREIRRQCEAAGVKPRKGSIVMLDAVYTASPEAFRGMSRDEMEAYFKECLAFHDRTYGPAFSAVIHLDETTPHMHVASVPIIEDEKGMHLSAKMVMGGRADYRARQDAFYEQVSSRYGLERGEVKADPAEMKAHTTKREWQLAEQEEALARAVERVRAHDREADAVEAEVKQLREEVGALERRARQAEARGKEAEAKTKAVLDRAEQKVKALAEVPSLDELRPARRRGKVTLTEEEYELLHIHAEMGSRNISTIVNMERRANELHRDIRDSQRDLEDLAKARAQEERRASRVREAVESLLGHVKAIAQELAREGYTKASKGLLQAVSLAEDGFTVPSRISHERDADAGPWGREERDRDDLAEYLDI